MDESILNTRKYKGQSFLESIDNYTVIDIETTGLSPQWDDIIEIAALRIKNCNIVDSFQSLINPGYKIDSFITDLTGITNEMLKVAPSPKSVLQDFIKFVGENIIIAHSANFDINFIYDNCMEKLDKYFNNNFIDTMRLSRRMFKEYSKHTLKAIAYRFGLKENVNHRAYSDAYITFKCYEYMKIYAVDNNMSFENLYSTKGKVLSKNLIARNIAFDESSPVFGKSFAFTGTLDRMTRREAMQVVIDMGGYCNDNVVKETNFLILGNNDYCKSIKDGKSNKHKKAEKMILNDFDIQIIPENTFYDIVQDTYNETIGYKIEKSVES